MAGESKLPDPFGQHQWMSPRRWINGTNVGRAARNFSSLCDRVFRGEASYEARSATARRALEANERAFSHVSAFHHVTISGSERTASNRSGLCFTAYLRPGSREEDAAELPREIRARRIDGSDLGYAFPVKIKVLPAEPIAFAFAGGDRVLGSPTESGGFMSGICCFAFSGSNTEYFITNTHVICEPDQDPINKECHDPSGRCQVGVPLRSNAVNTIDAAVVRMEGVNINHMAIEGQRGLIVDREDPWEGSLQKYFYVARNKTITCSWPEFVPGKVLVAHHGRTLMYARFWKLATIGALAERGHSGAALCREGSGGLIIAGIVFGGMDGFNEVWVYPASAVWKNLFH